MILDFNKLGFAQLNGRYIWIALVISVILLAITIYAQNLVEDSAKEGYSVIKENTRLLQKVTNISNQIQKLEKNIYKFTTLLNNETRFDAEIEIKQLQAEVLGLADSIQNSTARKYIADINENTKLQKLKPNINNKNINELVDQLSILVASLSISVEKYFEVMSNVETRYPAMPHLLRFLSPNNIIFSEAVESALQESSMTDTHIRSLDKQQYQIVSLFQTMRYAWGQKVSWLRIMISNRMGAFGDPHESMRRNLFNREIYADLVQKTFVKLDGFNKQNLLGLQQEESLELMHKASEEYETHFTVVTKIYLSDNWRADLPILKKSLEPNFNSLRKTIEHIEVVINTNANKGIAASLLTANLLTQFIWFFTTIVISLMCVFYFVFISMIRKPVIAVANALEAEAKGEPYKLNTDNKLIEIKQLDLAFTNMRNQVHSRQQRLEAIFRNAAEGILTIDTQGNVESINDAGLKLFDLTYQASSNTNIEDIVFEYKNSDLYKIFNTENNSSIQFEGEVQALKKNNETFPLLVKMSQMQIGAEILYILIVKDVSEQKALMHNLQHIAEHDALTGLYNRQYYSDSLEKIIEVSHATNSYDVVCMFLDLDNFKYINDTLGHMAGDRLLQEITDLLRNRMRKSDLLARIGGDEFSLIFQGINLESTMVLANQYRECIDEYKFNEGGKTFNVGCSIGLAAMTVDIENKDELLSRADVACHEAKRKGKNCIHVYELSDKKKTDSLYVDMGWSQRIKDAIQNNSFVFAKQNICTTQGQNVFAEEYLIRMLDNEEQGLIMPVGFLNSAERFGLMPDLDKWVVSHALETYSLSNKNRATVPNISINLSAKSVGQAEIFDVISESITKFKINPANIIFEITEDVAIADFPNAIIFLNKIRAMGCSTALDDFGAGYSSFSYLKEFPVDYVKIDGSFIVGIENNKLNYALVKAMHDVCTTLNKKTIVEFVENKQALEVLKEIGVDYVQGYYIDRPALIGQVNDTK